MQIMKVEFGLQLRDSTQLYLL